VVAVVVVAASLAVVLSGALSPTSKSSGVFVAEQAAVTTAAPFVNGLAGAPWQLTLASGFLRDGPLDRSWFLPPPSNCTVRNGTLTNTTIPTSSFTGSHYSGLAEDWVLQYADSSGSTGLTVLVRDGGAASIGEWSGPDCRPGAPLGTGFIDSTAAADALMSNGGASAYISAHPTANATFSLAYVSYHSGWVLTNATFWIFAFMVNGIGGMLEAEVFANNGTVLCIGGGGPCR